MGMTNRHSRSLQRKKDLGNFGRDITMNWIKGPISMGNHFACYEVIERCFGVTKLAELVAFIC